jgi:hypothetical protein
MVATSGMLDKQGVIAYVGQNAARFGLDPAAVLSVANHEGLNTAPGSSWTLKGEGNISFGPPSWYGGTPSNPAAGTPILAMQGSNAPAWSWTPAGLDYWLQQVAKSASGLSGRAAISAIVNGFERPREDLAAGEINNASADYTSFQQQIANAVGIGTGGATTDTTPAVTGTSAGVSGETGVQEQPALQSSATSGSNPSQPTSATLNFSDTIQHSIMQFLLVLVGLVLLLGGIYLIGSKS